MNRKQWEGVLDGAGLDGVGVGLADAGGVEPGGDVAPAGEVADGAGDVLPGAPVFADGVAVAGRVAELGGAG